MTQMLMSYYCDDLQSKGRRTGLMDICWLNRLIQYITIKLVRRPRPDHTLFCSSLQRYGLLFMPIVSIPGYSGASHWP